MKVAADLKAFEARLGHDFRDPALLARAVTHASRASATRPHNERMEFLGDRVLGLTIAEALLRADPGAAEGEIARRFNALVRKETCAEVARAIGLGDVMKLGRSEMMSGGRRKDALLADAVEAVIAAVFLDAGFEAAKRAVLRHWSGRLATVESVERDPKTALQEWAQARAMPPPAYTERARSGPDHQPLFTVEVQLADGASDQATAPTKRAAEQAAARALITRLEAAP